MNAPFTILYGKRTLTITSQVKVCRAYDITMMSDYPHPLYEARQAIWDTGAVNTVITPTLAKSLGLTSLGPVKMQYANGESLVNTYMINLLLPNKIEVQTLFVMEGDMTDTDVLIGMDVITMCDFALTNKDSKTVFSFDIPSSQITDYTIAQSAK